MTLDKLLYNSSPSIVMCKCKNILLLNAMQLNNTCVKYVDLPTTGSPRKTNSKAARKNEFNFALLGTWYGLKHCKERHRKLYGSSINNM